MRPPAQRLSTVPAGRPRVSGPGRPSRAALRHLAARTLARCSTALRAAADSLTRLRWRLEDADSSTAATARKRAVAARHPSVAPYLHALPDHYQPAHQSLAAGRYDLQFRHHPPAQ